MSRHARILLAIFALVGLAGLGVYLRVTGEPEGAGTTSRPAPLQEAAAEEARTVLPAELAALPDGSGSPASGLERVPLETARPLAGRVLLPAETPDDEELFVVARTPGHEVAARVDAAGAFELVLPFELARGELALRAHYLFADPRPYDLDAPSPGPLVLEPELGARLRVEVLPPSGLGPQAELLAGIVVTATAHGAPSSTRTSGLPPAAIASFDALPTERPWKVQVTAPRMREGRRERLQLEPGKTRHLRLPLSLGTQLAGRVVHADGRPAAGCEVTARTLWSNGQMFAAGEQVRVADSTGAFEFFGLQPGRVALTASASDSVRARLDTEHLEEGERVTSLELVLGEGDRLVGRVLWPDGRVASDAPVQVGPQYRGHGAPWSSRTDEEGRFEARALSGAPYSIRASATDEAESRTWRALLNDVRPTTSELVLILQPGNRVAGRVVDDAGQPVTRFRVQAQQLAAGNSAALEKLNERFRDPEGRYVFDDLPAGDWRLTASASGHEASSTCDLRLPESAGAEWELVLARAGSVTGRVLAPDGTPVSGGEVRVGSMFSKRRTQVDGDGRFELEGLPPGDHLLRGRGLVSTWGPPVEVRVAPGAERTEVELSSARASVLTGILHSSLGTEIGEREGRSVQLANLDYTFNASTTTDAAGRFSFEDLAPDTYRVYLQFASGGGLNREWAENYAARAEEQVVLAQGEERSVTLGAPRIGEIVVHGRLRLDGAPLENQLVYVYPGPEHELFPVTTAYAGDAGQFELRLPAAGDYTFTSAPNAPHGFGRRLQVPAPGPFELTIDLGRGSIAGFLLGPDSEPRPSHTLLLRRAAAAPNSRRPGDMLTTKTGADGAFRFEHLEDGRWELRSGGFYNDHRSRSEALTIRSDLVIEDGGALTDVELRLRPGAIVTGVCRAADGAPASGARIVVLYADGSRMLPFSGEHAAWDGTFHIPAVDPGPIELHAELGDSRTTSTSLDLTNAEEGYVELSFE